MKSMDPIFGATAGDALNDFGQVSQTLIGSISSPYIRARVFGLKLAHMHGLELWKSNYYQMMLRCIE